MDQDLKKLIIISVVNAVILHYVHKTLKTDKILTKSQNNGE